MQDKKAILERALFETEWTHGYLAGLRDHAEAWGEAVAQLHSFRKYVAEATPTIMAVFGDDTIASDWGEFAQDIEWLFSLEWVNMREIGEQFLAALGLIIPKLRAKLLIDDSQ